jgi:hypothetical protein
MTHLEAFLEQTWDGILSREPQKIASVFINLSVQNQKVVLAHLHKMAEESGWHPEQVKSAKFSLEVLSKLESS